MLQRIVDRIEDSKRSFRERMFILMNVIAVLGLFAVLLGDMVAGENIMEMMLLGGAIVFLTVVTYFAVHFHKLHLGAVLISLGTALVMLPGTFLFGGGLQGGSTVWVVFAYLYIGLLLEGLGRIVMFAVVSIVTVAEYVFDYSHPELAAQHGTDLFYVDSLISVIVVGLLIYVMVWFQNSLFMEENARAKAAIHEVEELNRAQNRFFSSMSHEIRTPINTILGLNELILRDDTVSDRIASDAKNIEGAGKMLLSIINDILDMSKIESGKMDIVPVSYRFADLLSDIVNMIWARADEKGLALHVDVDPDVPAELYGDEVRIKQILINLLNNAVKYTPSGSVVLHIESERRSGNAVWLTMAVTDTGSGIKKEALPYLFDAFKRVDEEKNRNIEGTGLGLSIVKQLVELMDGEITVDSVYTQGST
ncbi:MAG: fatty acid-binding protein DegV, partial [Lachnospiraceae bacterium]|nr:fatty acid-binding protein DegV [Lachnospiraceae bacterium]